MDDAIIRWMENFLPAQNQATQIPIKINDCMRNVFAKQNLSGTCCGSIPAMVNDLLFNVIVSACV
jgi:hypothetical protein